ncbi:MAG: 23S rRNA (uracil(1939)-C(5))-methyltransferase RlmD [Bacteroidales bacterium]|nr:23S rRNA (uracil(1939)-C(5))-methyltransferase RlmD [Bacteroidales bacterium]
MGRSRKNKPLLLNVEITDVAAEGKAISRVDDIVVFVNGAVPGDIVDVQITKKRSSYYEGNVVAFHKYSPIRVEPFCRNFGTCGGCKWQNMPYERQLEFKAREVLNNLKRIGKVQLPEQQPILASAKNRYYRNKLEFTFSNRRWLSAEEMQSGEELKQREGLGFHVPGLFDKVVDIDECHLQAEPSNSIRNWIKAYAIEHKLEFFDLKQQAGFLRTLIIRTASTGDVMVIVTFFREDQKQREQLLEAMHVAFPQITSLMYVINPKANDTITDLDVCTYFGNSFIMEEMEGIKFKIGPKSFYQTNSLQAYELYKVAREYAQLTGNETVYDLYTGTGTIANFVARQARKVIGIEYVPEAIEDAKVNSAINGIENTEFFAGDMKDVLTMSFIEQHGTPDVMIVDPPRAGMHSDVIDTILLASPRRIVYVSCNSATQARDINMLDAHYRVVAMRPVDMFPHTHHVESVVALELRENM